MRKAYLGAGIVGLVFGIGGAPSCIDSIPSTVAGVGGAGGGVYDAGFFIDGGEFCVAPVQSELKLIFQPSTVFLAPCANEPCPSRTAQLIVEPDFCDETQVGIASEDENVARTPIAPGDEECSYDPFGVGGGGNDGGPKPTHFCIGLHRAALSFTVQAGPKTGATTIDATVPIGKTTVKAKLNVVVLDPKVAACSGSASTPKLGAGDVLRGTGGLAGASISLPKGADMANVDGYYWHTDPFATSLHCASNIVPEGYVALGPAITFGPESLALQREIPLSVPVNPALFPQNARMRHLRIAYSGPAFKKPRTIPVADTHISQVDGQWAATFMVPRLGTYQAVIAPDAGTHTFKRRLTYRAVVGVSMGGGGTAMMGMRHHDLFDVLAPLGGPVDWTWELNYISENHLGGFRPIKPGTSIGGIQLQSTPCKTTPECKSDETCIGYVKAVTSPPSPEMMGRCTLMPIPTEPYEHPQTFNFWWYEYPSGGNGGTFARQDYIQIFRDLAIMFGNPNGENLSPAAENLPAGVPPTDKSVVGDHPDNECKIWVDPISCDDPNDKSCNAQYMKEQAIAASCPTERCAHNLTLDHYFDHDYNPDGTFPVITVCDSSPQVPGATPWSNEWQTGFTGYPLEVGLAVDYNKNGVRDELEPIIRAGHEKWYDDGTDHTPSSQEPGYQPGVNDDPAGDDYNAQYNPTGTEGDHRYEPGERFDDYGLDGVKGTKQQPKGGWQKPGDGYDVGEGDGKFTVAAGLQEFWDKDPYSIIRGYTAPSKIPAGELTDTALSRLDIWTDGGVRDLFNFEVDAQNLVGGLYARGRDVQYLTDFSQAPGEDPSQPGQFTAQLIDWQDLPGVVFQRYGAVDPTPDDILSGSGQHVGTALEVVNRLHSALSFIGSRWQDPVLRIRSANSGDAPDPKAPMCEIDGACTVNFTSKSGRTGPVAINLPPGYANINNTSLRYPVIYFLHGYGQDPTSLLAAEVLLSNWMNDGGDSDATRLPKAIVVYVDGRCRIQNGKAECLRGSFFTDSVMPQGSQDEAWWLELMSYVDQNYRTMPEGEVEWTE